jgi:hypothetical protein
MHVRTALLGFALLGLAQAAPAQEFKLSKAGPDVKVDADPEVDFTAFHTFGWSETQDPAPQSGQPHSHHPRRRTRAFRARV